MCEVVGVVIVVVVAAAAVVAVVVLNVVVVVVVVVFAWVGAHLMLILDASSCKSPNK